MDKKVLSFRKYLPRVNKRDVYGTSVIKYIVVDSNGFNSGEFNTKLEAVQKQFELPNSKIFKFMIYELLK